MYRENTACSRQLYDEAKVVCSCKRFDGHSIRPHLWITIAFRVGAHAIEFTVDIRGTIPSTT